MNLAEKLTLARQLERLGVDVIEAGFPIASEGDFEAVEAVAAELRERDRRRALAHVAGRHRARRPRARGLPEAAHPHLHRDVRHPPEAQAPDGPRAGARGGGARGEAGARLHCDDVEFSAEDATRSDWDYLVQVFALAVRSGATTLNVPDTVGYTTPVEYHELIRYLRAHVRGADDVIFACTATTTSASPSRTASPRSRPARARSSAR